MQGEEGAGKNHLELNLANETANELIIWVSLCLLSRDHNSVSQPSWEKFSSFGTILVMADGFMLETAKKTSV